MALLRHYVTVVPPTLYVNLWPAWGGQRNPLPWAELDCTTNCEFQFKLEGMEKIIEIVLFAEPD